MNVTRDMLVSELQQLLRLTAFEQTIATMRRTQAGPDAIDKELAENAEKSGERLTLLKQAVAQVGGVPDVVGPVVGKLGAFVTTQLNQVQTLQGALLGDLQLEHQLRERTRYARSLAETLGYSQVIPVLDRLETAHSATIDWLEQRLTEVARTGNSALRATPVQVAVTAVRRGLAAPFGAAAQGVNRAGGLVLKLTGKAPQPLQEAFSRATEQADKVIDLTVEAGRKATTRPKETAQHAAQATVEAVTDNAPIGEVGSLTDNSSTPADGQHPPFPGYDKLSGDAVMRHVAESNDLPDLQVLLAYEQAHKARKGVLQAVEERLSTLGASA